MTHTPSPSVPSTAGALVGFTPAARATVTAACRREGTQTIVVSWPAGAAYLPTTCYTPAAGDVLIGHIAGCPIYADTQRLQLHPAHRMLLDADDGRAHRPRPPLRLRPGVAA